MEQQPVAVSQYPICSNFNKHFKIDNKSSCNNSLANQCINHVGQLFNENGMAKAWLDFEIQFS